jgi:hypothetical protein
MTLNILSTNFELEMVFSDSVTVLDIPMVLLLMILFLKLFLCQS